MLGRNIATGHILEGASAELRRPEIRDIETLTQSKLDALETIAGEYEAARLETESRNQAWAGLSKANLDKFLIDHLLELAAHATASARGMADAMANLPEASLPVDLEIDQVKRIAAQLKALICAGENLDPALIARIVRVECVEAMQRFAKTCECVQAQQLAGLGRQLLLRHARAESGDAGLQSGAIGPRQQTHPAPTRLDVTGVEWDRLVRHRSTRLGLGRSRSGIAGGEHDRSSLAETSRRLDI